MYAHTIYDDSFIWFAIKMILNAIFTPVFIILQALGIEYNLN